MALALAEAMQELRWSEKWPARLKHNLSTECLPTKRFIVFGAATVISYRDPKRIPNGQWGFLSHERTLGPVYGKHRRIGALCECNFGPQTSEEMRRPAFRHIFSFRSLPCRSARSARVERQLVFGWVRLASPPVHARRSNNVCALGPYLMQCFCSASGTGPHPTLGSGPMGHFQEVGGAGPGGHREAPKPIRESVTSLQIGLPASTYSIQRRALRTFQTLAEFP